MCYVTILGVPSGGQAENCNGVGGLILGIFNHELGHALGLLHDSSDKNYPHHGEMFGIKPPKTAKEIHVGPTWAFDLPSEKFIPPTVQADGKGAVAGIYKKDPMEGGGGDQEPSFLLLHFSDYNVYKIQVYLERHVAVRRNDCYFKWDAATGDYMRKMENDSGRFQSSE